MVHHELRPANGFVCGSFFVIGKCFRPDRWAAGVPKAGRNIGGPAVQAPTSKGQGFHKNISLFCDSIVGASIARPLRPCDPAEPYPYNGPRGACAIINAISVFRSEAGFGSARICRSCKPQNIPPHRWRACDAGPYEQRAKLSQKYIALL